MGARRRCLHRRRRPDARAALRLDRQAAAHAARPGRSSVRDLAAHAVFARRAMNAPLARVNQAAADDSLWYKDAIIYQLHVKSFCDSNNDGIGDFPGLISRLDYIAD